MLTTYLITICNFCLTSGSGPSMNISSTSSNASIPIDKSIEKAPLESDTTNITLTKSEGYSSGVVPACPDGHVAQIRLKSDNVLFNNSSPESVDCENTFSKSGKIQPECELICENYSHQNINPSTTTPLDDEIFYCRPTISNPPWSCTEDPTWWSCTSPRTTQICYGDDDNNARSCYNPPQKYFYCSTNKLSSGDVCDTFSCGNITDSFPDVIDKKFHCNNEISVDNKLHCTETSSGAAMLHCEPEIWKDSKVLSCKYTLGPISYVCDEQVSSHNDSVKTFHCSPKTPENSGMSHSYICSPESHSSNDTKGFLCKSPENASSPFISFQCNPETSSGTEILLCSEEILPPSLPPLCGEKPHSFFERLIEAITLVGTPSLRIMIIVNVFVFIVVVAVKLLCRGNEYSRRMMFIDIICVIIFFPSIWLQTCIMYALLPEIPALVVSLIITGFILVIFTSWNKIFSAYKRVLTSG